MLNYIGRRLLLLIPVLIGISLCVFLVMQLIPGDVISAMLGIEETPELRAVWEKKLGLDQPLTVQYLTWIGKVLRGDFGVSYRTGTPILPEILSRFSLTAELTLLACLIGWLFSIPLGLLSAVKQKTWQDKLIRVVSLTGISIPNFALATLLILFLSKCFGYYSPMGYVSLGQDPAKNLQILILPAIVLGAVMAGAVTRMTRSSVLEVLKQDYIKAVRAKGASEKVTIFRHAFKNGCIPVVTLIGMQIGNLLGGTVVVEQVFSLPGLGQYTLTAINQRDYPVVEGCVLFIAFVYVLVNLLVDILYTYLDPRISYVR